MPNTRYKQVGQRAKIKMVLYLPKKVTTEKEIQREISKHWDRISRVPFEQRPKKGAITNEEAKNYWLDRIKEVEQKLKKIKPTKNKVTVGQ